MRARVLSGLLACLLLVALPVAAQEQSGSIHGVVKDSSGGVLPGVTVEARTGTGGVQTVITDAQGVFRFPALPPGTYEVSAVLEGFTAAKIGSLQLALGQLLNVPVTMQVAGVAETVQVTGEAPLIDVKQNASFATIDRELIDKIPKGRDFTAVVTTAPGANSESYAGGIQVDGASGSENRFVIDGMDTTAMRSGTQGKSLLVDFVQEVQVKSSGYNAEFGGATGGVISAISKSGTNVLKAMGGLYYTAENLRGEPRQNWQINSFTDAGGNFPGEAELVKPATNPYSYVNPVVDVGGPLLKDRIWYYAGWGIERTDNERTVRFWNDPTKDPAQKYQRTFNWSSQQNYLTWNLNTQLNPSMRLKVTGQNQWSRNRGTAPSLLPNGSHFGGANLAVKTDGFTNAAWPSTVPADENYWRLMYEQTGDNRSNNVFSGNFDWVVSPTFFINLTAGSYRTNTWQPPELGGQASAHVFNNSNLTYLPGVIPDNLRFGSGYNDNPKGRSLTNKVLYGRAFLNANATLFKSWHGQHTVKAGARYERLSNEIDDGAQFPEIRFYWNSTRGTTDGRQVRGQYGYYRVRQIYTSGASHSNNWGFWLQDSWTIMDRLTVNAGVRLENEEVPSYTEGGQGIEFGFREKLAPRVGFAWDVKGDGRWKAYGSYGKFFDITKLSLPISSFGGDKWIDYFFTLDTYDWKQVDCSDGRTGAGCPGTLIELSDMRFNSSVPNPLLYDFFNGQLRNTLDPDLKPYETGELTLGLDHELNRTTSVGVRYVHKWLVRAIEDVGVLVPNVGEVYFIANPGYGVTRIMLPDFPDRPTPPAQRDYDSVEFRVRKRLATDWSLLASYTWSRLYGNYSGLASSDESGRTDPNVSRYFDALYMSYNAKGEVSTGPLYTDRPHQVKAQVTYDLPFGTTLGLNALFQSGMPVGGLITWQGYPVFISERDSFGRTPFQQRYDLQVQHEFRVFGNHRINVNANIDNLFDLKTVTDFNQTKYRNTYNFDDETFFAGFDVDDLAQKTVAAGGNMRLNPIWQKPYSFMGRRQIRFGVKYSF